MISLWSIAILTVFAISMGFGVRNKIMLAGRLSVRNELRYIAEAGINQSITLLSDSVNSEYDTLLDSWSNNLGAFYGMSVDKGKYSICYNYYDAGSGTTSERYGMVDEERKLNLNKAKYDYLSNLFKFVLGFDTKQADDLAAAIVDWRDKDDFPLANGAESYYYRGLSNPYESKNNDFDVIEELMLVRGMSKEAFQKIKPFITVYGNGKVNINTAHEPVLIALGLNQALVKKILVYRAGADKQECTYDDNIFNAPSSIVPNLSQVLNLSPQEVAALSNLVSENTLGTSSSVFSIISVGKIENKTTVIEIACIFDRSKVDSGENAVKYWNQKYYTVSIPSKAE